jgi:hypothetical protein
VVAKEIRSHPYNAGGKQHEQIVFIRLPIVWAQTPYDKSAMPYLWW